ncbi:unnamed protein product [Paramecium sonneborni]|uniref:Transmembrane protein n=1 Tax=Paramecium sonneborni TaxID=65129 RepID=A0A8S1R6W6_9CILI|nr:unnamed protein product [Paramecium sonneborni]
MDNQIVWLKYLIQIIIQIFLQYIILKKEDSDRIQKASKINFLLGLHNNKIKKKLEILKIGKIQTGVFIVDFKEPINLVITFNVALATQQEINDENYKYIILKINLQDNTVYQ